MDAKIKEDEAVVEEYYEQLVRRWPLLLGAVLVSVAVGAAVIFGGRTIYRHVNNPSHPKPAKTTHSIASTKSGAAKSSKPAPKTSTNTQTSTNASLPNSGPGQVFEIFAVTSLGAATLHFVISNKRTGTRLT
jgi:hypothetical protein